MQTFHQWESVCAVARLAQGPEIRTGFLENEKPVLLEAGHELTITTDYSIKGNKDLISMSYAKLAKVRAAARAWTGEVARLGGHGLSYTQPMAAPSLWWYQ